jgi:hypothetical protein
LIARSCPLLLILSLSFSLLKRRQLQKSTHPKHITSPTLQNAHCLILLFKLPWLLSLAPFITGLLFNPTPIQRYVLSLGLPVVGLVTLAHLLFVSTCRGNFFANNGGLTVCRRTLHVLTMGMQWGGGRKMSKMVELGWAPSYIFGHWGQKISFTQR